jgi:hypothetical protein
MKVNSKSRIIVSKRNRFPALPVTAFLGAITCASQAPAQSVIAPSPQFVITPPALQQLQTNQSEVFPPAGTVSRRLDNPLFKWGPVGVRPRIFYRILHGDGILVGASNQVSTVIQEISPGILFDIGSHWSLDYMPTWRIYSNDRFKDTLGHAVSLTGGTAYEDWVLGLSQAYSIASAPLVETGTQTELETFSTALTGSYRFNSKMWADLALNQSFVSAESFTGYREWSTTDWLNYQYAPALTVAAGVALGYVDVDAGSDMLYERFLGRAEWRATDKLGFNVNGGVETRQFLSGGEDTLINPLVGAGVQYQPVEATRLSLNVDRTVTASYFVGVATETTQIHANLNQRLLGVLYLDIGGGYHSISYVDSSASSAGRSDDYYVFNTRLSCAFLKRGTAAVFYQYSDNSSTAPGFTFESTQVGMELGYRY